MAMEDHDHFIAEGKEALRDALTGASGVTLSANDHRQLADINYMKQVDGAGVHVHEWQCRSAVTISTQIVRAMLSSTARMPSDRGTACVLTLPLSML